MSKNIIALIGLLFLYSLLPCVLFAQEDAVDNTKVTKIIKNVSVKILDRTDEKNWFSLRHFINKEDSENTRNEFVAKLEKLLFDFGYTQNNVDFKVIEEELNVSYEVLVKVERICSIKNIHISFRIPSDVFLLNNRGDVCDRNEIEDKINLFTRKLKDKGFKEAVVKFDRLDYSSDNLEADLYITGELGEKYVYKIYERKPSNVLNGIWGENPLKNLNYEYASDETAALEIKKFYLERGFFDVLVDQPFKVKGHNNTIEIVFSVDPGFLYKVGKISFRGNDSFSSQHLLDQRDESDLNESISIFNRTAFDDYIKNLREFYFASGFWDVKVSGRTSRNVFNYTIDLDVRIDEGLPYYLNKLEVTGCKFLDLKSLEVDRFLNVGHTVDPESINLLRKYILTKYRDQSFLSTTIQIKLSRKKINKRLLKKELVDVQVAINEGRKAKITVIEIEGLKSMEEAFVLDLFTFKVGDFYTFDKIEETRRKLVNLGVFDKVHFSREEDISLGSEEYQAIIVRLSLQESLRGNVSFGPGYNYKRGFFYNSRITYSNIFGEAQKIQLAFDISQEKNQPPLDPEESLLGYSIQGSYSIPFLLKDKVSSRTTLSQSEKASSDIKDLSSSLWTKSRDIRQSFKLDLDHVVRGLSLFNYYHYLLSEELGGTDNLGLLSVPESKFFLAGVGLTGDFRDSATLPQQGLYSQLTVEKAGLLDLGYYRFIKTDLALSYYFKILENKVLAFHISNTLHNSLENFNNPNLNFLPRASRIFLSGTDRIRGFKKEVGPYSRKLGQLKSEKGLGGTRSLLFKLEFHLYKIFYSMAGLTFFVDGGNTFFSDEEARGISDYYTSKGGEYIAEDLYMMPSVSKFMKDPFDFFDQQYYGAGIGINFALPLGVLNVSLALPIHQPPGSAWDRIRPDNKDEDDFFDRFKFNAHIGTRF